MGGAGEFAKLKNYYRWGLICRLTTQFEYNKLNFFLTVQIPIILNKSFIAQKLILNLLFPLSRRESCFLNNFIMLTKPISLVSPHKETTSRNEFLKDPQADMFLIVAGTILPAHRSIMEGSNWMRDQAVG